MTGAGGAGRQAEAQRSTAAGRWPAKSTLNRLELSRDEPTQQGRHDPGAIESLFVELFLEVTRRRPNRSSSTSMPSTIRCTGNQEGRFFHGYYDCYCYLPLYIFCGRHLPAASAAPLERGRRRAQWKRLPASRADPPSLAEDAHSAARRSWPPGTL